ncbi:hypothetical protein [Methylobacterium sp. JK268]
MRRAIIHIGTPRTGSSSLQTLLFRHRGALREAGIVYPDLTPSGARPHLSHQYLGAALAGRRPRRECRDLLATLDGTLAASTADVALISYESLCLLPSWHRAPRILCDLLESRGFRPEILVVLRPQAEALQSQYLWRLQFLRESRPLAACFAADLRQRRLDYLYGVSGWARAAGGRVHLVPYRDRRSDALLTARIAAELGLADRLVPLLSPEDLALCSNRSLDAVSAEVARRLHRAGSVLSQDRARAVTMRVEALAAERGLAGPVFQGLDADLRAQAAGFHRTTNDLLARHVWGTDWADRVEEAAGGPVTERAGRETGPGAEGAVTELLRLVRAECSPAARPSGLARALDRIRTECAATLRRVPVPGLH